MRYELKNMEGRIYFVVIFEDENQVDRVSLHVLEHNEMKGILKPCRIERGDNLCLYYDISRKNALAERLSQPVTAQFAYTFLHSLCEMWREEEGYFLKDDGIVWDTNYMYVENDGSLQCLYIPVLGSDGQRPDPRECVLTILSWMTSTDMENWTEITKLFTWLRSTKAAREDWYDIYMENGSCPDEPETEVLVGDNPYVTCILTNDMMPKFKQKKKKKGLFKKWSRKEKKLPKEKKKPKEKKRSERKWEQKKQNCAMA